jgi:hypothetical protein
VSKQFILSNAGEAITIASDQFVARPGSADLKNIAANSTADAALAAAELAQTTADVAAATASAADAAAAGAAQKSANLGDLANFASARSNLGLGSSATLAADADTTLAADSDANVATQRATKRYVDNLVTGVMRFKGSTDCSSNPNYPSAKKGEAYVVSAAGKIGGSSGLSVEVGDVYVAIADNAGGTQASVGSSWDILQYNLVGALLSSNNLSDLTNTTTARTNLGLGTAATSASSDFATAAQGTLASTAVQKSGDSMTGNLSIALATNGAVGFATTNTDAGTGAQANLACTSNGGTFYFGAASTASAFSGGGFLYTNANVPLTLWTWNTKRMTIPGNGDATLHTGLAVQGALSTTGDVTVTKNAAGGATVGITNTNATGQPQFSATSNGGTFYFGAGYTGGSFNGGGFIYTAANAPLSMWTNNTKRLEITGTGNVGVGGVAPTARLHLPAGTSNANTAPLKLASGTNLTTAEDGAFEYDGSNLSFTVGTTRKSLTSPSPWTFDQAWNSAGSGAAQYITVAQLAANALVEVEVNLRAAVASSALTSDFVMIKARASFRRPGTTTYACQVLTSTQDKQGSGNGTSVSLSILEQSAGTGTIVLQLNGVAGITFVGQVFGWAK